jgi:hypothetical protein
MARKDKVYQKFLFTDKDRLVVKYSKTSLAIAEAFIFLPLVIGIMGIVKRPRVDVYLLVAGILIFAIIAFLWFKSYQINIENGILHYYSPFFKKRAIPLNDIEKAFIEIGNVRKKDEYRAFERLVLKPKLASQSQGFYINLKVFEYEGVKKLLALLPMKD